MRSGRDRKFGLSIALFLSISVLAWIWFEYGWMVPPQGSNKPIFEVPVVARVDVPFIPETPTIDATFAVLAAEERRESWLKPFRPQLWSATGWTFDESAMLSNLATYPAIFRQPYVRCSVGFRVASSAADAEAVALNLELRSILNREGVRIELTKDRIEILELSKSDEHVLKVADLSEGRRSYYLRTTVTGHRLLVAIDDQLVANVNWPTSLVGQELVFSLVPSTSPLIITEMRIDGESATEPVGE